MLILEFSIVRVAKRVGASSSSSSFFLSNNFD